MSLLGRGLFVDTKILCRFNEVNLVMFDDQPVNYGRTVIR